MESYSCTTYKEQFNAEILNDKEKQEGCLQVKGDGEILRAEVHHISPKGRHTMVVSSNPPMQQKAFQPWGKDNWPTKKESICLLNWREYNMDKYPPGPICRTIHKTAESARKCMAQIPGPNFIGYKPELMADNWHPVVQPLQATITREKNKGKRTPATQLKPYWRTNYPSYSVWDEGTPATSIPSLVKELAKSTKRPRSASQSSSSSNDNYPVIRKALDEPPMGPPLSKARKAKAHFYRMKAGEGTSDVVQYHPTPNPSGVVEAEVSPPKEIQEERHGFPIKFLKCRPIVTRGELDRGLQSYNDTVRQSAFRLHMMISSGKYLRAEIQQLEQEFLEVYCIDRIQSIPEALRTGGRSPNFIEILNALRTTSPMFRRKAIQMYKTSVRVEDEDDPSYQAAAESFYQARRDVLETIKLLELGVININMTDFDRTPGRKSRKEPKREPKIIGTMTIADDLFNALDSDDPNLKACANDYYSLLVAGTSLRDPRLNTVCKKFKAAMENHNAQLRRQVESLQTLKGEPALSLIQQLHDNEDMQANLSRKIKDLTLIQDQAPTREAEMGQPEVKPQGNLWEQPEAIPDQPIHPVVHIPEGDLDESVPALVGCVLDDFAPDEKLNKENLDAPIKTESDSSVEEQITEAMVEQE